MLPDKTTPTTYGLPKNNYDSIIDPTTDLDALTEFEPMAVDVAAMTYTAPRAWARCHAAAAPTILDHSAVWGDTAGVAPAIARNGDGDYTITWAASYADMNPTPARQVTRNTNIRGATATPIAGAAGWFASVDLTSANSVTVHTFTSAGAAGDVDFMLVVY